VCREVVASWPSGRLHVDRIQAPGAQRKALLQRLVLEGRQAVEYLGLAVQRPEVRPEPLVRAADEEVRVERPDVDGAVRCVGDGVDVGQRPDLVIFYDGVNDVFSAYQQQVAGLPQNEFNRVREFNLSRAVKRKQRTDMVLQDVAMRLSTMRFVKGLIQKAHVRREAAVAANTFLADSLALQGETLVQDVVASYTGNIEVVKALGEHYHFKYLFYWQPTVFQKAHLTDYERVQAAAKMQTIEQFVRRTYEVIRQSTLAERRETSFHDLSLVFADLREPVYVDWSHLGESGNEIIARRMAGDVLGSIIANKEAAEHRAAPDGDSAALHRRR